MKKFRSLPAIITLLAGFVTCVLMLKNRITIVPYLWTLALVMIGFYIVGIALRLLLNKVFEDKKEEPEEEEETEEGEDGESESEEENSEETKAKTGA